MNFREVLVLPKMADSAQKHKSMSFIWIVWSTLHVYLWPEVWFLWSKQKIIVIFQKCTFTLLIIFIVKSLQKEQKSTNLLLWPLICRNKPAIIPKWFNSLDTNSNILTWIDRIICWIFSSRNSSIYPTTPEKKLVWMTQMINPLHRLKPNT